MSWWAPARLTTVPAPAHGLLSLWGDGRHADQRGPKHPRGQQGRLSQHHPWFLGLRFVLRLAAWDGERSPVGCRRLRPKRHADDRSENAVLRARVGAFVPRRWAKGVIVGGAAAEGSQANRRLVQDRDQADPARRGGCVCALARTGKTAADV